MRRVLILGVPGAGKTERLLREVERALARGVRPDRIAFVTFTKAAVAVAIARAVAAFGLTPDDLPHFRTVHSLAFRELGLSRKDVLGDDHLEAVSEVTGELLASLENPFSDAPAAGRSADPLLTLDHYARTTERDLLTAWSDHGSEVEWHRLLRFSRGYAAYKEDEGVLDFTDMLTRYADSEAPPLAVDLAIVDEAQDLSKAQWRVIFRAFAEAPELFVAGDDMQMIHHWAGADEDRFLGLRDEGFAVESLTLSHRLPRAAFSVAREVGERIDRRYARNWSPSDREGSIDWVARPEEADLGSGGPTRPGEPPPWLLLARTRSQLPALAAAARDQGVAYSVKGENSIKWPHVRAIKAWEALRAGRDVAAGEVAPLEEALGAKLFSGGGERRSAKDLGIDDASEIWHDALAGIALETREYYLAVMRSGRKLTDDPTVRIDTIHGSKGAEADNVMLVTDGTFRTSRAFEVDPDAEHRVFFVGATRVRENMIFVAPATAYGYRI